MARVTATEVKVVIPTELTDAAVDTFIGVATDLVDGLLGSSGLGSTRLKNIELYLAAHFVALRDQDLGMMGAQWVGSEAKVEYDGQFGKALELTRYGQMAQTLDTTGSLSTLGKARAQFRVV